MQALMLAAGMGKRLQRYTEGQTKCMLNVAGRTLLERTCDALKKAGIHKLIIVVGYEKDRLIQYALNQIVDMELEFVYNLDYEKTNNIYSLYLARNYLKEDATILLESDLIFDASIIKDLVDAEEENLVAVAKFEYWMDGTVCYLDKAGHIEEFLDKKEFNYKDVESYYKTVNIYKFSKQFVSEKYIPFLEAYINVYGKNQYYESVLKIISHINKMDLIAFDIGNRKWYEIDNAHDFDIAETIFQSGDRQLLGYEMHYGGYWRFPKVYDYCYLVNPFFPNQKIVSQMQYMYQTLITQYPSGMKVQKLNVARIFNVNENNILVGNGAAELINVMGHVYDGIVGVTSPVFNEYLRCFSNILEIPAEENHKDLAWNKTKIRECLKKIDMLILVNPDNPSGYFASYEEIISIIDECSKHNVKCLVDESFIDFADPMFRYTLINQELLDKYQNLIVIKSISKSYGVPGFRLGVMVTSDEDLLMRIQNSMSIWNINSFAEYFLEILPLYRTSYKLACNQLATERERFISELKQIRFLQVFPSQANFIMCQVIGVGSRRLANWLIDQYYILIKDLSTKTGIKGKDYIRIAVKSKEDNDKLVLALKEIGEKL